LAVVRAEDLHKAHHALNRINAPFNGCFRHKADIQKLDELNAHIRQQLILKPVGAKWFGLKEVSGRPCLDARAVNDVTLDLIFQCGSSFDAISIMNPGNLMAKVDLKNAFHQLALHPKCGKLLGMQLAEGGDLYVPKRAVFGGKSFPHLMNSFMAEVKRILDASRSCT